MWNRLKGWNTTLTVIILRGWVRETRWICASGRESYLMQTLADSDLRYTGRLELVAGYYFLWGLWIRSMRLDDAVINHTCANVNEWSCDLMACQSWIDQSVLTWSGDYDIFPNGDLFEHLPLSCSIVPYQKIIINSANGWLKSAYNIKQCTTPFLPKWLLKWFEVQQ